MGQNVTKYDHEFDLKCPNFTTALLLTMPGMPNAQYIPGEVSQDAKATPDNVLELLVPGPSILLSSAHNALDLYCIQYPSN